MKRRLIEQACGCSVVGGGGGREVHARLCLWPSVEWMEASVGRIRGLNLGRVLLCWFGPHECRMGFETSASTST